MSSVGAAPRAAVPASNVRAEASRKNGARSRGPKTPEGKTRSAQNALKHGLRAEKYVVLPDENAAEFAALEAALRDELAPEGALQSILVGRIARAAWRLERAERLEVELFEERRYGDAGPGLALIRDGNGTRSFDTLLRYRGAAIAELMRSLRALKALQAEARAPARTEAPVRLAAVRPTAAATPLAPPAAREKKPIEPERRRHPAETARSGGRATPSAPRASVLGPASGSLMRLPAPGGAALRTQPSEPETWAQPGESPPPAASHGLRRARS